MNLDEGFFKEWPRFASTNDNKGEDQIIYFPFSMPDDSNVKLINGGRLSPIRIIRAS